ncbi:hypothetical protein [Marinimicrobium alkaliphilum]|uniref:hypothetical protein n=1 Tax=Marinimicrobium alkaliphilum TaxID=2202654 RepID=UPI000DB9E332|nr:hypothetical protein [Marinimicrobium alkaliphilum]
MKFIEVVKLEASDDRSRFLYSVNSPRPDDRADSEGFRLAGWVYITPAMTDFFDGNVYFDAKSENPRQAVRNVERADVNKHLSELGIKDSGAYGFEFKGRQQQPGTLYVEGRKGRRDLAKIVFRREQQVQPEQVPIVALVGHSASGKSAVLEQLGLDRAVHDMDYYFLKKKRKVSASAVLDWMRSASAPGPVVLSNDTDVLRELAALKNREDASVKGIRFVFLNRSLVRFLENLKKKNTDGCFHPKKPDAEYRAIYFHFLSLYGQLADDEICYEGEDLTELTRRVESYLVSVSGSESV